MTREMKNSGIEWIGDIPSEWCTKPINSCFKERNEKVSDYDWQPLSVTKNGIVKQLETAAKSDAHDARKKVCTGDFVINSRSDRKQSCGVSNYDGSVSLINIVLKNNSSLTTEYIKFSLKNYGFAEEFYKWGTGIVDDLWSTNYQRMKKIMIPVPPLPEQKRIADFLDNKVTEIDKIISETKASIENYKEYKQAVITEAVTKGLDKNVPMKDSGIEWIGEIPVDWRLGKIKSCVTKVGSGKTPKGGGDVYSSEGVLFLRSQNVYDTGLVLDDPTYISEEIDEEMKNTRVMDKDVLLNITGGSIGRCCIYDKSYGKANVNQHVSIIRLKQDIMFPEYMHYYWLSSLGKMSVNLYQTGGNREGMSADAIKNSPIIYTSISTQKEIIAFLDSKCAEIDNIILEKEKLITNLEEYKKSLIYEYVTGKKVV